MKKILILVDKIGRKKELFAEEIAKRLKGSRIVLARFSDLYFEIDQKDITVEVNGMSVKDFDLVYFRRAGADYSVLAATLAFCLKHFGINFIDTSWVEIGPLGSKFTSLVKEASLNLPVFHSIYVWKTKIDENKEKIVKRLGFPLIAKELSTQRGRGVHKINSYGDLSKLPMKDAAGGDNQYLFQEFVDLGEEFRLLVLGEKVAVWEKKVVTAEGEFRHNVSLGAKEEFLDISKIPPELEKIAIMGAKVLGLQIAGVDVAKETKSGKYRLIEVNRGPGLTYDTKISPELSELAKFFKMELEGKYGEKDN